MASPTRTLLAAAVVVAWAACHFDKPGEVISLGASGDSAPMIPRWELVHETPATRCAALNKKGTEGWAFAQRGVVLHFQGGRWTRDELATALVQKARGEVGATALSGDGKIGWAVGPGRALKLENGVWGVDDSALGRAAANDWLQQLALRDDGAEGWAFSFMRGLHLLNGTWRLESDLPFRGISSIEVLPTGVAWAIGLPPLPGGGRPPRDDSRSVFLYSGGTWRRMQTPFEPHAVAVRADGAELWVVGDRRIGHYDRDRWTVESHPDLPGESQKTDIWFDFDRRRGWIRTPSALFSFRSGRWVKIYSDLSAVGFAHLVMSGDGSVGFVMDWTGIQLELERGQWRPFQGSSPLDRQELVHVRLSPREGKESGVTLLAHDGAFELAQGGWRSLPWPQGSTAIALGEDAKSGTIGWAVGAGGKVQRYRDGRWTPDDEASRLTQADLLAICASADGTRGWAVGERGTVLALVDSEWRAAAPLVYAGAADSLGELRCSEDARTALARGAARTWRLPAQDLGQQAAGRPLWVGDGKVVWEAPGGIVGWHFDSESRPARIERISPSVDGGFRAAWMNPGLSHGWAAGAMGGVFTLQKSEWSRDGQVGALTGSGIYSIAMNPGEDDGWAAGQQGTLLRYRPIHAVSVEMKPDAGASLRRLEGSFDLVFPAPLSEPPTLALFAENQPDVPQLLSKSEYRLEGGPVRYHLAFLSPAAVRAEELKHKKRSLEVRAHYRHVSLPIYLTYHSRPFPLIGPSPWWETLWWVLGVVGLNLLVLLGATRLAPLRTVVLNPVSSNFLGVVLAKYLVIDQLIRHFRWIKLALFRDFRHGVAESPPFTAWATRTYVAPRILLPGEPPQQSAKPAEPAWRQVFRMVLNQPRGRVWLAQGPSGLGKSALLEKWLGLALELGQTPLLIALRGEFSPQHEAAVLMEQWGDLRVSDDLALDLIKGGGFVLLLDGLNEDRSPEVTREFVQRAAKHNLVVLTSQFEPDWARRLDIRRVQLEPFGEEQLEQLLDREWAGKILASPLHAQMARLPVTAQLLAAFVRREGVLPSDRLQIYASLVAGFDQSHLVNLEEAAWGLFKANEFEFPVDGGLPKTFCDQAVAAGVLTIGSKELYGFVHETIRHYLTACYLDGQDARPLTDWHQEIRAGIRASVGRVHWEDVLDFWGELKARRAVAEPRAAGAYEAFLREAAEFDRGIFARRLYPHYDRLCTSGVLSRNADFVVWSARSLAGAVADAPS